jgi:hypothetical protein
MNYILFEDHSHFDLLPFCFTRPIYALRAGILTTQARWEMALKQATYNIAYDYLGEKYNKNASETQQSNLD